MDNKNDLFTKLIEGLSNNISSEDICSNPILSDLKAAYNILNEVLTNNGVEIGQASKKDDKKVKNSSKSDITMKDILDEKVKVESKPNSINNTSTNKMVSDDVTTSHLHHPQHDIYRRKSADMSIAEYINNFYKSAKNDEIIKNIIDIVMTHMLPQEDVFDTGWLYKKEGDNVYRMEIDAKYLPEVDNEFKYNSTCDMYYNLIPEINQKLQQLTGFSKVDIYGVYPGSTMLAVEFTY